MLAGPLAKNRSLLVLDMCLDLDEGQNMTITDAPLTPPSQSLRARGRGAD